MEQRGRSPAEPDAAILLLALAAFIVPLTCTHAGQLEGWGMVSDGLREKAIERSRKLLEPGEAVRRVYFAQGGIPPQTRVIVVVTGMVLARFALGDQLGLAGGAIGGIVGALAVTALTSRRLVLRTDRSLVVLAYNRFAGMRPSVLSARLPKDTPLSLSGTWAPVVLDGEKLWIHKRWQDPHHVAATLPGM
ncbi:hypothetical protein [Streptomyces sp. NPDC058371]|uniref:hypothetical protein n=1 Tax=Streptomyces sp. NPDC058371 TaxID=3346463 RepID=UPI00366336A9